MGHADIDEMADGRELCGRDAGLRGSQIDAAELRGFSPSSSREGAKMG